MIPENGLSRRGKAPLYKTNARERSRAFRGQLEQQRATQVDEKPSTPVRFAVGASNNPGSWSIERVEDTLRVRTLSAARNLRDDNEKAAERKERREPERSMEAHKLADSGKHPMRKTMTAVARDAAIGRDMIIPAEPCVVSPAFPKEPKPHDVVVGIRVVRPTQRSV